MNEIVEKLPMAYPDKVIHNFDMKMEFVLDCLSSNASPISRKSKDVEKEYDNVKNKEHQLYDSNTVIEVNCCGALWKIGFRDYRNYLSNIIMDRVQPPSGNFLDFGSGNGFNAKILSEAFPQATIHCIDLSQSRLDYARQWIGQKANLVYTR